MKPLLPRILAAVIGGIYLLAGVLKLPDPAQFAQVIFNYRLLPWPLSAAAALYLPWLEILCGVALLFRFLPKGALALVTALTLAFAIALLSAWLRGLNIECGCFGRSGGHSGITDGLLRDILLLAALAVLWRFERQQSIAG